MLANNGSYFPHDLDDIYEYKTDHQYFTHTGDFGHSKSLDKPAIHSDSQRNNFFHRTAGGAPTSLDEYTSQNHSEFLPSSVHHQRPQRFENSSFIKGLTESDSGCSQSPSKEKSKNSLHGLIKNFGKKAQIWSRKRHESTCNISSGAITPTNDPQENFRMRSKSLDVNYYNNILNDCDATYKIFDKIVREGNIELFYKI